MDQVKVQQDVCICTFGSKPKKSRKRVSVCKVWLGADWYYFDTDLLFWTAFMVSSKNDSNLGYRFRVVDYELIEETEQLLYGFTSFLAEFGGKKLIVDSLKSKL